MHLDEAIERTKITGATLTPADLFLKELFEYAKYRDNHSTRIGNLSRIVTGRQPINYDVFGYGEGHQVTSPFVRQRASRRSPICKYLGKLVAFLKPNYTDR